MSDNSTVFKCGDQGYINTTISTPPAKDIYACGKYEGAAEKTSAGSHIRMPKLFTVVMAVVMLLLNVTNGEVITNNTLGVDNLDVSEPLNMTHVYGSENNARGLGQTRGVKR